MTSDPTPRQAMGLRHIALRVAELELAEAYYARLFEMEVATRESRDRDGSWRQLPSGATWRDAERAGVTIGMVALVRDELAIALFPGGGSRDGLYAIGITAAGEVVAAVRSRLGAAEVVEHEGGGSLAFLDRHGVRWQLGPAGFRTAGERGEWLEL